MLANDSVESAGYRHASAKEPTKRQRSLETSAVQVHANSPKRRHRALVSQDRTLENLRQMAKRWMKAELEHYEVVKSSQDKPSYFPWIPETTKRSRKPKGPPNSHLVNAANEFARRFPFRSTEEEEDMNDEQSSKSPFLLVAINVRDNWAVTKKFQNQHAVRFMLVPGETKNKSILFIKCMAGPVHGVLNGFISFGIDHWIIVNKLWPILLRVDAGGKEYQPDKAWRPKWRDRLNPNLDANAQYNGGPFARVVIEVEYAHRDAKALREFGFVALDNPYTRLFLGVKIWKMGKTGNFAAAAILWGKNDDGVMSVRRAVDFGTIAVANRSKVQFQEVDHANMLPPVVGWIRPQPNLPHASLRAELDHYASSMLNLPMNEEWGITLPAADLLYKTSTDESTNETPYCLDMNGAIPDCLINLQLLARQVRDEV